MPHSLARGEQEGMWTHSAMFLGDARGRHGLDRNIVSTGGKQGPYFLLLSKADKEDFCSHLPFPARLVEQRRLHEALT